MFPEVPSSSHQASQSRTLTNSASVNESNLAPSTWHFCLFSTSINLSCFLNAVNSSARCLSKERTCAGRSEQVIFEVSVVTSEKRIELLFEHGTHGVGQADLPQGAFSGRGEGKGGAPPYQQTHLQNKFVVLLPRTISPSLGFTCRLGQHSLELLALLQCPR